MLIPGGLFVLVTYGGPDYRLPYLEDPACGWDVLVYVLTRHEASRSSRARGDQPACVKCCVKWQARPLLCRISGFWVK